MGDWNIQQLREIESACRQAQGKHIYLNGQFFTIQHLMLVQPAIVSSHGGRCLEIDTLDADGNKHEIRLYTPEWPEHRRA